MTARPPVPAVPPVDPAIVGDIRRAARAAHVDFAFMMAEAGQESSFKPDAKASTSSATGLYQFLDTTWLGAVKQWGAKHGLGQYADQITAGPGGFSVADPALRQRILDLRQDPAVSAALAGELAHQNKQEVERALGHPASSTDLYLAHFLGARGATEFMKQIKAEPTAKAADLLPQAAEANKAVFYDQAGEAKTVTQIYQSFADRIERQVSQYAQSAGVDSDTATEAVALNPAEDQIAGGTPLLATMNVLALAALKLIGRSAGEDGDEAPAARSRHRVTDTSA